MSAVISLARERTRRAQVRAAALDHAMDWCHTLLALRRATWRRTTLAQEHRRRINQALAQGRDQEPTAVY